MDERRRHPRVPRHLRAWLTSPRRSVLARLHDASSGGIGLRIPSGFAVGEELTVGITLSSGVEVGARAVVAWVTPHAIGVRFVRINHPVEWQQALY